VLHRETVQTVVAAARQGETSDPRSPTERGADELDLSIVLPVFDEEENLRPLVDEIDEVLAGTKLRYEIIAVDDGSTDASPRILEELAKERGHVRVVLFRRNSGQAAAFDAGFRHASGRFVATMDADRQNDPRDIPALLAKLEDGYDLVTGWRRARKDGALLRRMPSLVANHLIRFVTGTRVHDLGCSLKVYRREITDEIRLYGEMHRFLVVLAENQGARVAELEVNHRARVAGASKYGLWRTAKVVLDLMTVWFLRRFATKPVYLFGGAGLAMIAMSVVMLAIVLYEKLALEAWVHRNPLFNMALVSGLLGVQSLGLGLLAELMVRTYFESQGRSAYPIKRRIGFPAVRSIAEK
jgi:glycosyltransferase involved in cell wall biosynthesis